MPTSADILAVQQAFCKSRREAAISEIRRRWSLIAEYLIDKTLEHILSMSINQPPPPKRFRGVNWTMAPRSTDGTFQRKDRS